MASEKELKDQRDRFLAFSFASADLFVEISEEGNVVFALGAAKGLTGIDEKEMIGRNWLEIFSSYDQALAQTTYERAKPGLRCGPLLVSLNEKMAANKQAILTGIKMPGSNKFYITLGLNNEIMARIANMLATPEGDDLLDRENFTEAAQDLLPRAAAINKDLNLSFFEIPEQAVKQKEWGDENWENFREALSKLLITSSFDGFTAAEVSTGRYGLLHDKDHSAEALLKKVKDLALEKDPEGKGLEVKSKTVRSDMKTMSERDASRALLYTINEFSRKGTAINVETLNSGFDSYVSQNAQKIKEFQGFIQRSGFNLLFQPIVDLKTFEATHFEMLCRFDYGDTLEWIMFGEDVGLAPELDLAVCERAINYVSFKAGGTRTKFSINLSGQSIEDEEFFVALMKKLKNPKHKNLPERLMFEITESSNIANLEKVADFVTQLREHKFKVALDDFGAGSASFQYLQKLHVDYVKIDGKYVRKLMTSNRDVAMVKHLAQMCKELGIHVIAEYVEEEAQLNVLRTMGIEYGQGYFFGKPSQHPDYLPARKKQT